MFEKICGKREEARRGKEREKLKWREKCGGEKGSNPFNNARSVPFILLPPPPLRESQETSIRGKGRGGNGALLKSSSSIYIMTKVCLAIKSSGYFLRLMKLFFFIIFFYYYHYYYHFYFYSRFFVFVFAVRSTRHQQPQIPKGHEGNT